MEPPSPAAWDGWSEGMDEDDAPPVSLRGEGFLEPVDLSNRAVFDERIHSVPPEPPTFEGLWAYCGEDKERKKKLLFEILEIWARVAGPPQKPEHGYRVRMPNRVAMEREEGHILKIVVNEVTGQTVTFMICSMFTARFVDYASIANSGDLTGMHMWERYTAPWKDSWTGLGKMVNRDARDGPTPPCGHCLRDMIVMDQFTAYFLGRVHDEPVPVRKGSHSAEFDEGTGMLQFLEYDVVTSGMTELEYQHMRADFMEIVVNAITARESAVVFAAKERARIRAESPQVFANMLAKDLEHMLGPDAPRIDPVCVKLLQGYHERKRREAEQRAAGQAAITELDGDTGVYEPDTPGALRGIDADDPVFMCECAGHVCTCGARSGPPCRLDGDGDTCDDGDVAMDCGDDEPCTSMSQIVEVD